MGYTTWKKSKSAMPNKPHARMDRRASYYIFEINLRKAYIFTFTCGTPQATATIYCLPLFLLYIFFFCTL